MIECTFLRISNTRCKLCFNYSDVSCVVLLFSAAVREHDVLRGAYGGLNAPERHDNDCSDYIRYNHLSTTELQVAKVPG